MKRIMHFILTLCLIGLMTFSSFAADSHVYDEAGILTSEERSKLEAEAASVSEKFGCGIYMITVNDYKNYSSSEDVYKTATELYHGMELGSGDDREGILLLISMKERDYATFFYGKNVEYAFDGRGQFLVDEAFLDDFGDDRWYDGFYDYVKKCDELFALAAEGTPVRGDDSLFRKFGIGCAIFCAMFVAGDFASKMNNVSIGISAKTYVTDGGFELTEREDRYLYTTKTRSKKESSSESRSGGGGSGRSGKF